MPFDRIARALDGGRGTPASAAPRVYEPTARRVYSDLGLPELFVHAAAAGGLSAHLVHLEDLPAAVADHLGRRGVARVRVPPSNLIRKVGLAAALATAGLTVTESADAALVTGCDLAVAETGSLVYRAGLPIGWHGAAARVVVLEPKNFVPDLIDLMTGSPGGLTLVSGPADVLAFVLH